MAHSTDLETIHDRGYNFNPNRCIVNVASVTEGFLPSHQSVVAQEGIFKDHAIYNRGVAVTSSEHGERRVRMEDGERRIEMPGTRGTRRGRRKRAGSNELTIIANH
ncbi:hypothetical protein ALC62_13847 [Cyphomyrmex costatus]|uniref:Uncharacterized protein n=1 Tax=Cyphomyrmex costatus TaxID=456900 RepID=A0A195C3H6_9HYME|nr:hypothetical protein ALC62_13847 [Cyphomyrmex costatus]